MTEPPSELELLQRARRGDSKAAGALWHRQRRWVTTCLLAHMPGDADLEDLIQEVGLRMWDSVHTLRDPTRLRPWLRRIAVNLAVSAGRARSRGPRLVSLEDEPQPAVHGSEAATVPALNAREVLDLLEGLPSPYREPLLLKVVEGLSQRSIADLLEVPESTVESRLARGRRLLRESAARLYGVELLQPFLHPRPAGGHPE